ncbi:uncharacterized protein LOC125502424 [Dendroctonus ponderosae]|uniref:uncharacterized protein LOC125502424 n=1 Tax=Dendroctonus ponderosae TaxID=77166 RepID=UPI0020357D44|nr:uncharacterized protein LOC125502424 [Dendroctonus ponderosae]
MKPIFPTMLIYISTIMGLCPPIYFKQRFAAKVLDIIWILFWTGAVIATCVSFQYTRIEQPFLAMKILEICSHFFQCALAIVVSVAVLKNGWRIKRLLNVLRKIDYHGGMPKKCDYVSRKIVVVWFFLLFVKMFFTRDMFVHMWIFACAYICFLRIDVLLAAAVLVLYQIIMKYHCLNQQLNSTDNNEELIFLASTQRKFFYIIDEINRVFGPALFCSILVAISLILIYLSLFILAFTDRMVLVWSSNVSLLIDITYLEIHVCGVILLADKLSSEIKKTVAVCHQKSQRCALSRADEILSDRFLEMAQQTHLRQVELNAAGFFVLDNSAYVFIISTICTYLTVLCQTTFFA